MATKVHHQPEFMGANQLLLMLDFLRNADAYGRKFQELDDLRREVNKLIDAQIDLSQIDAMRAEATVDRTTAKQLLADSTARADELVRQAQQAAAELTAEAEASARKLVDATQQAAADQRERADRELATLLEDQREAASAKDQAQRAANQAAAAIEAANAAEALAKASREKYEMKYATLRGALSAADA
jgi:hypothetical protein